MQITRSRRNSVVISLVAMIDVLMIMLVFFMVTSTYLDLDMIPLAEGADPPSALPGTAAAAPGAPFMVRVGADGTAWLRGQAMSPDALIAAVEGARRATPGLEVLVLPSGQADVQALVRVMDAIAASGVQKMRIIRLEARP
jgi:biopolymer transport protein ExbD